MNKTLTVKHQKERIAEISKEINALAKQYYTRKAIRREMVRKLRQTERKT